MDWYKIGEEKVKRGQEDNIYASIYLMWQNKMCEMVGRDMDEHWAVLALFAVLYFGTAIRRRYVCLILFDIKSKKVKISNPTNGSYFSRNSRFKTSKRCESSKERRTESVSLSVSSKSIVKINTSLSRRNIQKLIKTAVGWPLTSIVIFRRDKYDSNYLSIRFVKRFEGIVLFTTSDLIFTHIVKTN